MRVRWDCLCNPFERFIMSKNKFWMCWNPNKLLGSIQHESFVSAQTESTRLAAKEKCKVYVLCCVGFSEPQDPPIVWKELAETGAVSNERY